MRISQSASDPSAIPSDEPGVLVVDDVKANLSAVSALLDGMGCSVVLASSGNEALRYLLRREFAVLLLDVQMPEMDGYEVAQHVRRHPPTRDLPIIFLTATHDNEENVLRGYDSGAVDFLFKPFHPAILRSKIRVFLELYNGRREIADAKVALERSNAELRELAESKASLADRFQKANQLLGAAYSDLQQTQSQLVQSAKMASLGELVAGVAHEINNPLAFALSHLDTVRRSLSQVEPEVVGGLSEAGKRQWERARDRASEMGVGLERIRDLVVKLRNFSRLDEGECKRVSIRECIDSVLMILSHRTKDRIDVVTRFGEPDQVDCFPGILNQALMNLTANAIDAIEGPGRLEIASGARDNMYEIAISDSGTGIPPELRERVLEPFFTTKPVGVGTGLGLSITYSIVKKHGGKLELLDAEGGGTKAVISIPLDLGSEGSR